MRDLRPPTILLVDGNGAQRSATSRMLAAAGFWLMEASTADEALRLAAKHPQLVVLGTDLPDMAPREVCRHLKSNSVTARIPVLRLSLSREVEDDKVHLLECSADAYLSQSCSARELRATIQSLLRMRNAEETARASALEWQQTFNAITDAICLVDFEGRIVHHNRAMLDLVGAAKSLVGHSVQEVLQESLGVDPASLPRISGTYLRQSVEVPTNDRWFRVTLDPVLSSDGTVLGAVKILSDITGYKRAEEERTRLLEAEQKFRRELQSTLVALKQSQDRSQRIFNSNLVGIIVAADSGEMIEVNEYFAKLVGYSREELMGGAVTWRELTAPEYRDLDVRGMEELTRYGICTPFEKEYLRRDGVRVPVLIGAARLEGRQYEHVAFVLDLTERKRQQEALRRAQERFRVAHELSLDGYNLYRPVLNPLGEVVDFVWEYLNPASAAMFGRDIDELLGCRLLAVLPGQGENGLFETYRRVWMTGEPHDMEFFYDTDGINGWFRNMVIRVDDGVAVSFSDITERKRAEAALRLNEKLAATGRLAASIAHEINNPMSSVTNLLYLLDTHAGLDPKAHQYVTMARQELSRVSHIVKQMLGFYRESPKPVPVNLCEVVDNVLDLFRHKLAAAGVSATTELSCQTEVQAFPGEMRQVFTNLVGNAIEAVGPGGKLHVRVSASRDWRDGRPGIRVLVADNGPGIRPEHRAHLFEPFFTTKGEKGTGLGLWVTYSIVRKHNGLIRVRSSIRPGRSGTAFTVFIPGDSGRQFLQRAAS